ncbi:hypothetical protein ACETIH_23950 [Microvirga arabica]|uniref:Calcium-binding protein n=1 Tax=Microvirga arabica TaxID=1128671 RepID=A0ABV6YF12_9HYPH
MDHLQTYGTNDTLEGWGGDDFLTATASDSILIGGLGSDTLILSASSGLSDVTVYGGNEVGLGNPADHDVLSIRQNASFAGIFGIDRLEFMGRMRKQRSG